MVEPIQRKKGGDVKQAPPGYYLASEAMKRLGVNKSKFQGFINTGAITRVTPPRGQNSYYDKHDIDVFADELEAFDLMIIQKAAHPLPVTYAQANRYDIPGITNILRSYGWPHTPEGQREKWYERNDRIDYLVRYQTIVLGYVNIAVYPPDILEAMMSGKMRAWDLKPHHILPFKPQHDYACFSGIAIRDVPFREYYGQQLILGFFRSLCEMASDEGIIFHKMYATSSEPDGEDIANDLGFVKQEAREGDLFGRYVLDANTGTHKLVQQYRKSWRRQ